MTIDEIISCVEALDHVVVQKPQEGDGTPELAWGDVFIYYSTHGSLPVGQPFATIVTKDYPGEPPSDLVDPASFRLNVDAGRRGEASGPADPRDRDVVMPHPVYAAAGWVCVVDPGPSSADEVRRLLREAHTAAARRAARRSGTRTSGQESGTSDGSAAARP